MIDEAIEQLAAALSALRKLRDLFGDGDITESFGNLTIARMARMDARLAPSRDSVDAPPESEPSTPAPRPNAKPRGPKPGSGGLNRLVRVDNGEPITVAEAAEIIGISPASILTGLAPSAQKRSGGYMGRRTVRPADAPPWNPKDAVNPEARETRSRFSGESAPINPNRIAAKD